MRIIIVLLLISFSSTGALAQYLELGTRSLQKLRKIDSTKKKLIAYHKLYRKDSIRLGRRLRRNFKHAVDSIYRSQKPRGFDNHPRPHLRDSTEVMGRIKNPVSLIGDSAKCISGARGLFTVIDSAHMKSFKSMNRQFFDIDSLSVKSLNSIGHPIIDKLQPSNLELSGEGQLPVSIPRAGIEKLSVNEVGRIGLGTASEFVTERSTDIVQDALDHAGNTLLANAKLAEPQRLIGSLMSRYRKLTVSATDTTGVGHTSLSDRAFTERLFFGTDFNISNTKPFAMDFAPQFGYKINARWIAGFLIRCTISVEDTVDYTSPDISADAGLRLFTSYAIHKSYSACAEFERSRSYGDPGDGRMRMQQNKVFIGLWKKFLVHSKFYMVVKTLYDLNAQGQRFFHPSRLQLRVGLQLSELATRKKQVHFDPNRW